MKLLLISLLLIGIGFSTVWAAAQQPVTVTYASLNRLILNKNGAVLSAQANILTAKSRTGYLDRISAPQLSASLGTESFITGGGGPYLHPFASADLSINLFQSESNIQEENIRQAQVTLSRVQSNSVYKTTLIQAQSLYWEIVQFSELMKKVRQVIALNDKTRNAANLRFQRGLLTRTDVLGFDLYKDVLEEKLESLSHERHILMMTFKSLLGLSDSTPVNLGHTKTPYTPNDTWLKSPITVKHHPEILELEVNKRITDLQKRKLEGETQPTAELFGTLALYTLRDREFSNLSERIDVAGGVRVQIPIWDGAQNSAEVAVAENQRKSMSQLLAYQNTALSTHLKTMQEELIHLDELIHRSEKRLQQSKVFLNSMLDDYDRGVKSAGEVLGTVQGYMSSLEEDTQRRKNYQKSRLRLVMWSRQ